MNDVVELQGVSADTAWQLANGALHDPYGVLGPHDTAGGRVVRAYLPGARGVDVVARSDGRSLGTLMPMQPEGLFVGRVSSGDAYRLRIAWPGAEQETEDPYAFTQLLLSDDDLHLFNEGRLFELAFTLGAVPTTVDGVSGVRFAIWAPNARAASVVGDFNTWDPRRHPMRLRFPSGVWELFIPRLEPGTRYKFALIGPDGNRLPDKADPLARATEAPAGDSLHRGGYASPMSGTTPSGCTSANAARPRMPRCRSMRFTPGPGFGQKAARSPTGTS